MAKQKRCQICHVRADLIDGRCHSCRMAKEATDNHMTYGKYMAAHGFHIPQEPDKVVEKVVESGIEMVNCKWCGKPFPKSGQRIYCSDLCYKAKNYAAYRERQGIKTVIIGPQICPKCGKEFTPVRRGQIYCSRECRRLR